MTLPTLAVIDWGIGGFGVARELDEPHLYISDAGFTPYGKASRAALVARLTDWMELLASLGVVDLVIACNAASTVRAALPSIMRVHDVIGAGIRAVQEVAPRRLGVIGGRRTIASGHHRRALAREGLVIRSRVAQPLSAMIERGELGGAALEAEVARIVRPLGDVDTLLLACTHYPAITPVIERALPGVRLVDPAPLLVDEVARARARSKRVVDRVVVTTGEASELVRSAELAFGVRHSAAEVVVVTSMAAAAQRLRAMTKP